MQETDPILADLNPQQLQAVTCGNGPIIVFAGAGSGKTRVLTRRIAYLVERNGISPFRILAVTFTNKAAEEMRDRVEHILGRDLKGMWVSTFHSACARILRMDGDRIGIPRNFVIYDEDDQLTLIKILMKQIGAEEKNFDPRLVRMLFDQAKNKNEDIRSMADGILKSLHKRWYLQLCDLYDQEMHKASATDFGDLITKTAALLETNDEIRAAYRQRFNYILVDEFQDTNLAQYSLLKLLVNADQNLFVVGDDDQSIYHWRGANLANILNFEKDFTNAAKIVLGQNYRSSAVILDAAQAVVRHNRSRSDKSLFTTNKGGEKIKAYVADDEYDEARFAIREASDLIERRGVLPKNIAIFYRTNAQSRVIEEECVTSNLRYAVVGGLRFYERKEIKDIVAYCRLAINPDDSIAARRIINTPLRGIGAATEDRIQQYAALNGISFLSAAISIQEQGGFAKGLQNKIHQFLSMIGILSESAKSLKPSLLLKEILQKTGYEAFLSESKKIEDQTRLENINELLNAVYNFEKSFPEATIEDYLASISLMSDQDYFDPKNGAINMMTIHCAKGLEFDCVFIVGMEEGLFPHVRSLSSPQEIEEERRICYVAMTRARHHLFLSCARARRTFGNFRSNPPSRFLSEIPSSHLIRIGQVDSDEAFNDASQSDSFSRFKNKSIVGQRKTTYGEERISYGIEDLWPGRRVNHPVFGEGIVMHVEGRGEHLRVVIRFDVGGVKTVLAKFAKLEPL